MRLTRSKLVLLAAVGLVAGLTWVLGGTHVPLGVPGQWEWFRITVRPIAGDLLVAVTCVVLYAVFVGLGYRALRQAGHAGREARWVASLAVSSVIVQFVLPTAAPPGYGLAKWSIALYNPYSSGYYSVARSQIANPVRFLEQYPEWVQHQTVPRLGSHPPGLFLLAHAVLRFMDTHPEAARGVLAAVPETVTAGFVAVDQSQHLPRADRATLATIGALTLLVCALTVVPLYILARAWLAPPAAWSAAALWAVLPAAIMFNPTADTAFPFLSCTALALAAWAGRARWGLAVLSGMVLAFGMTLTLAFLPIGLTVGIVLLSTPGATKRRRLGLIMATGFGFFALTLFGWLVSGANPFVIWIWNRRNHAKFYEGFPRGYASWVLVDWIELAVAIGLPAALWAVIGLSPGRTPRVVWATLAVLALLNFGGLTLSEVGRLWLPWMPVLLIAAAVGLERLEAGPTGAAGTVVLVGIQVLIMQALIQVVYPV